jgi:hypothetical protein
MFKRRSSFLRVMSSLLQGISLKSIAFVVVASALITSCYNEPEFLGNNLLPGSDIYQVRTDTSFVVSAYTMKDDSLTTYVGAGYRVLGGFLSKVFGYTQADFVSNYYTDTTATRKWFQAGAEPDSLYIYLPISSYYGDSTVSLNIKVYELTDTLARYQKYNGIEGIKPEMYHPTPLQQRVIKRKGYYKVLLGNDRARDMMDSTKYKFYKNFYRTYKGFFITCDDVSESTQNSKGGVLLTTVSPYMLLKYKYPAKTTDGRDTIKSSSKTYSISLGYNHYHHDYTKADPLYGLNPARFNDTLTQHQDSVFYLEGQGGVYGMLKLDGVMQWADSLPALIHKAELVIPRENFPATQPDTTVNQLYFYLKADGTESIIIDQRGNSSIVGGKLRKYNNDYAVNITFVLQDILNKKFSRKAYDKCIYVYPYYNTNYTVNRVILRPGTQSKGIKLKITYTRI